MFETNDSAEIQIPPVFGDTGDRLWTFVRWKLHTPWFHVVYQTLTPDAATGLTFSDMMFLTWVKQLLLLREDPAVHIEEVDLVSPGHMNGSNRWKLEPLAEIWEGIDPGSENMPAHVYVLENGARYMESGLATPESELRNLRRILTFEAGATTPGRKKNKR